MGKIPIINQIIKDKRKKLKLNQSDFAKLINKSKVTIARYETGTLIPLDTLNLICNQLKIDFYDLILQQIQENIEKSVDFYKEIILLYETEVIDNVLISIDKKLEKISGILEFYYNCILNFPNNDNKKIYFCEFKDDKFYIKVRGSSDIILVLTPERAEKLIIDLQNYFNFQLFQINTEINKKTVGFPVGR